MTEIKAGYNDQATSIRIYGRRNGSAELWINQRGLPDEIAIKNYKEESGDKIEIPGLLTRYKETLSYITINELIQLKNEIEEAIKVIAGINTEEL